MDPWTRIGQVCVLERVAEILEAASALVACGWCQGTDFRGAGGEPCESNSATRFSVTGAIVKIAQSRSKVPDVRVHLARL